MAIPVNRQELLDAINKNYNKLQQELSGIPLDLAGLKELEGHAKGTRMSINDLLAYLTGWAELILKWNRKRDRSESVDFPETGYKWNELGRLAQKFYQDFEGDDFDTLSRKLSEAVRQVTTLVESKTNDELYGEGWYEKWTLGRMIQLNTASPYANARTRIRKWKKERNF